MHVSFEASSLINDLDIMQNVAYIILHYGDLDFSVMKKINLKTKMFE